jgi:hypothetical protein
MLKSDGQKLEPQVEKTNATVIERLRISLAGKEFNYEYGS